MITEALKAVAEFHTKAGAPVRWGPFTGFPTSAELALRAKLIKEESKELRNALMELSDKVSLEEIGEDPGDPPAAILTDIADGLADLLYVTLGTILSLGFDGDAIFAEVHRSNMTKFDANGNIEKRADGKGLKGPHFEAPDLRQVLHNQVNVSLVTKQLTSPYLETGEVNGIVFDEENISEFLRELEADGACGEEIVEALAGFGIPAYLTDEKHPEEVPFVAAGPGENIFEGFDFDQPVTPESLAEFLKLIESAA